MRDLSLAPDLSIRQDSNRGKPKSLRNRHRPTGPADIHLDLSSTHQDKMETSQTIDKDEDTIEKKLSEVVICAGRDGSEEDSEDEAGPVTSKKKKKKRKPKRSKVSPPFGSFLQQSRGQMR